MVGVRLLQATPSGPIYKRKFGQQNKSCVVWTFIYRVMLTCAFRAQIKEVKMEIKNKFYIENITFETFKTLNLQFSSKNFYICILNLCL